MILVDTNVLFSLVVENDLSASAVNLHERDDDWHSERHAFVELTNLLVRYVRNRTMSIEEARLALARAESVIGANLHRVLHSDAFDSALRHRVSVYDARFLVAAEAFATSSSPRTSASADAIDRRWALRHGSGSILPIRRRKTCNYRPPPKQKTRIQGAS